MGRVESFKGVDRRLLVPFGDEKADLDDIKESGPRDSKESSTTGFDDTTRCTDGVVSQAKLSSGSGGAGGKKRFVDSPNFEERKSLLERLDKEVSDVGFCVGELGVFKDSVKEIVQEAFIRAQEITAQKGEEYTILPVADLPHHLTEQEVNCGDMATFLAIRKSVQKEISVIKRKLVNVVSNEIYTRWISGADRGRRVDPKLISRIPLGEENFFKYKVESDILDIACCLLIDESGSMWGNKCQQARRCGVMFSEILHAIKIPFEVIGFSTESLTGEQRTQAKNRGYCNQEFSRAENLAHYMYKRFGDDYERVKTKLVNIRARSENFDQDDIEFAWTRLQKHSIAHGIGRKLLIVVSDGLPVGGVAARQKLKRVINTIGCDPNADIVGIGINTPYVKDFYHKCIEIDDASEMGMNVVRLLSSAILTRKVKIQ